MPRISAPAINQLGLHLQPVIPSMRQIRRGSIVNVGSTAGLMGAPWCFAYVASTGPSLAFRMHSRSRMNCCLLSPRSALLESARMPSLRPVTTPQDRAEDLTPDGSSRG